MPKSKGRVSEAVKKYVHRVADFPSETKNSSLGSTTITPIADVGALVNTSSQAQGTSIAGRVGLVIKPVKYSAKMWFTATTPAIIRCLLISVPQMPTTIAPTITNILVDATAANAVAPASAFNQTGLSAGTFRVHYDRMIEITTGGGLQKHVVVNKYAKSLPGTIHYNGPNAVDYGKNTLYWIFVSNQPVAANNCIGYFNDQIMYKDA